MNIGHKNEKVNFTKYCISTFSKDRIERTYIHLRDEMFELRRHGP